MISGSTGNMENSSITNLLTDHRIEDVERAGKVEGAAKETGIHCHRNRCQI